MPQPKQLPPAHKSWYARFEKPSKPPRRAQVSFDNSPVAKRTRSGQLRRSTEENLGDGDLRSLFDPEIALDNSVLSKLKETWEKNYSSK
jgi:hypothetical protein